MFQTFFSLPLPFWVVAALIAANGFFAFSRLRDGVGLPMLAVLFTVTVWYVGDAFYNDYPTNHAVLFEPDTLQSAWWQVAWFLIVFMLITPVVHRQMNGRHLARRSGVLEIFNRGIGDPVIQRQLTLLFRGCVTIWIILAIIAAMRLQERLPYFFFPFLGYKAEPWGRARIGSGFDALLSLAFYIQLLVTGIFGVVAALLMDRKIRRQAFFFCLLTWPYFIFDRTRNTMLAIAVPGIVSWVFLRLRGGIWKKSAVLIGCFLVVNAWMGFVIANRSTASITGAFRDKGFSLGDNTKVRHEGLNMFEELCWINQFIERELYQPNWGYRYFAEVVNPIPRALWRGKPLIGIDYAILRGQGGGEAGAAGVYATISTGILGQGVVNFGRILGPAFVALLMSLWVALLARLDLQIQELGYLPLYSLGLILTFNLGRDITLITLYPFVFGAGVIWWLKRSRAKTCRPQGTTFRPGAQPQPAIASLPLSRRRSPLVARRISPIRSYRWLKK